jgi:hypothetical protein
VAAIRKAEAFLVDIAGSAPDAPGLGIAWDRDALDGLRVARQSCPQWTVSNGATEMESR